MVFEGLDTHATVTLNGREVLKTDNMFISYRIDITDQLADTNQLQVHFESSWMVGKKLENAASEKPLFCHNGDSSRLQVRKAQYHYGWDWGITLLTCGPWKPVYLEVFSARISHFSVTSSVEEDLQAASIQAVAEIIGSNAKFVRFHLLGPTGQSMMTETKTLIDNRCEAYFNLSRPELWYPVGNGAQPLYTITASLLSHTSDVLSSKSKKIGLRRCELIQRPLKTQPGTTFFFQINNIPIFCRGADWIPAESFLPRLTLDKYRKWIDFTVNGNHNMIRVWGGGIYEHDLFYTLCDELGIMVWQDFMLGCGAYPVTPSFQAQIESEAVFNIARLRHHPSIVLWCGNNEDHMFADRYPSGYDASDHNVENWLKTRWPGRIIYDKLLPKICAKHCPEIPYHPGSPWGGTPSNSTTEGDVHAWGVWMKALEQFPYQQYPEISGRFVSEFGMKSYPSLKLLEEYITDPKERYPQSKTMDMHQKSASKTPWAGDWRNIALYMYENFKVGRTLGLKGYVYASQLLQAEAMMFAYIGWRRLWKGPGREECAGALCWQLNDCWPVVSWSLGDYDARAKLAYWTVKRACAAISVGVHREEVEGKKRDGFTRVHVHKDVRLQVWGSNFTTTDEVVDLLVEGIDIETGKCVWQEKRDDVVLTQNQSTELIDIPFPDLDHAAPVVAAARVLEKSTGKVIARFADWPQPLRHIDIPRPEIQVEVQGDIIKLSAPLPVKGLELSVENAEEDIRFEDNCLDLMPGDEQVVHVLGLNGRAVEVMHLALVAD